MNIYAFADEASKEIDLQIKAMKRNNLNGLEIRSVGTNNISVLPSDEAREIRKKMDDNGLVTWSIGSPIGKIDIEEGDYKDDLEKYKHCIELCDILGAKNIRLFSFRIPKEKNPEDYREEIIERMNRYMEIAEGTGISICHENEKGIYGDISTRCKVLFDNVPGLKGIFDPANFVQCNQETLSAWELLKDKIYYMHIKDALTSGVVVPSGLGDGNVQKIAKEFTKMGGNHFTIEPHLHDFGTFKSLEIPGKESIIGKKYVFKDNDEAFDTAVKAFREIMA